MLEGLTVLELGWYVAAPSAAAALADWGADVIKIEPLTGDPFRRVVRFGEENGSGSPVYEMANRGKRSIAVDIRSERGAEVIRRLLPHVDVLVTSLRSSALARIGLSFEELSPQYPALVYAMVSGYGLAGPDAERPGYDTGAFFSRSGISGLHTHEDGEPVGFRAGMGDQITAMATVSGIMAALYRRAQTGQGGLVSAALVRAGAYTLGWDHSIQLRGGSVAPTRARARRGILTNVYAAADGIWFWIFCPDPQRYWPIFARDVLRRPDLLDDERFADPRDRHKNNTELVAILDETFASAPMSVWAERLAAVDMPWEPAQSIDAAEADSQLAEAGTFATVSDGSGGTFRSVSYPVSFSFREQGVLGPVAATGAHTAEILAEYGFSEPEVATMVADRVVAG
jgi:crotonobetainyl-CoA:carnitine CoA-transferase CaiB-like acyl-CoA transferase